MFSENGNTLKHIASGGHDASYPVSIDYQYRTIVVKVFGLCGYWKKNPERKFVLTCENKQKPDKPYRMHPYCALPNRIEKSNKNQFFFLASTCHCFLGLLRRSSTVGQSTSVNSVVRPPT